MVRYISLAVATFALIMGGSAASKALSIPAISKNLNIAVASSVAACNALTGHCEVSTLRLTWDCVRVFPEEKTCSGTLTQDYFLNNVRDVIFEEFLAQEQVAYDRASHRVVVASEQLGSIVFAKVPSGENTLEKSTTESKTETAAVTCEGCLWLLRKITREWRYQLKVHLDGFTHPVEGRQTREEMVVTHRREIIL